MQSNQWAPPPLPWCAAQGMGNSHSFCTQRSACWEQFKALNGKIRKFSKHFTAFTSVFEHCALLPWVQGPSLWCPEQECNQNPPPALQTLEWLLCFVPLSSEGFVISCCFSCSDTFSFYSPAERNTQWCASRFWAVGLGCSTCREGRAGSHWPVPHLVLILHLLPQLFPSTSCRLFSKFQSNMH